MKTRNYYLARSARTRIDAADSLLLEAERQARDVDSTLMKAIQRARAELRDAAKRSRVVFEDIEIKEAEQLEALP